MQHCLLKKRMQKYWKGNILIMQWHIDIIVWWSVAILFANVMINRMYFYMCSIHFTISKILLIIFSIRYHSKSHWIAIDFLWYIFLRIFVSTIYTIRPWNVGIHIFVNDVKCVSFLTRESMIHHLFAYLQK